MERSCKFNWIRDYNFSHEPGLLAFNYLPTEKYEAKTMAQNRIIIVRMLPVVESVFFYF